MPGIGLSALHILIHDLSSSLELGAIITGRETEAHQEKLSISGGGGI